MSVLKVVRGYKYGLFPDARGFNSDLKCKTKHIEKGTLRIACRSPHLLEWLRGDSTYLVSRYITSGVRVPPQAQ